MNKEEILKKLKADAKKVRILYYEEEDGKDKDVLLGEFIGLNNAIRIINE